MEGIKHNKTSKTTTIKISLFISAALWLEDVYGDKQNNQLAPKICQ